MKKLWFPVVFAVIFLAAAVVFGRLATGSYTRGNPQAAEALSSGSRQIGTVLADVLWLQLDRYHHIWMYQGYDWATATDYLPQLWLITKLDPDFAEAYIDGGYHLGVNLGYPEEGLELLDQGVINCPDDEEVFWEKAVVLWETNYRGYRATHEAVWDYLRLVSKKRGDIAHPWNEANANMLLEFTFEEDSLRRNHMRIAERYSNRTDFIRFARRSGLWTPEDH